MKSGTAVITKTLPLMTALIVLLPLTAGALAVAAEAQPLSLEGTWIMAGAYEIRADGARTTNYGEHPDGLLMIDREGRYSLQIFRHDRPKFASGDKKRGTPDEYREAALGSSTHTGRIVIDPDQAHLTFKIDVASYPNWNGTQQVRDYTFKDGVLTYSVPASASGDGTVAYSVWRRVPE